MKIDLLEKIEGEAYLEFKTDGDEIVDVRVLFPHFRGVENILVGKDAWDALVINPRVCGICGHAHLQATASLLESIYRIEITQKAQLIREITRFCEIIQNHLKWCYLVIFQELQIPYDFTTMHQTIALVNKLLALFSGQWPHSAYAIPGGVTCDPTALDIVKAKQIRAQIQSNIFKLFGSFEDPKKLEKDLKKLYETLHAKDLLSVGIGLNRFITLSQDSYVENVKILNKKKRKTKLRYIKEIGQSDSYAKNVTYNNRFYETGPLARLLQNPDFFIRYFYRKYKDSIFTRIIARIYEINILIKKIEHHLNSIDLNQLSVVEIEKKDGEGAISIEAARGSLVHKAIIAEGKIENYSIITPTQWNLSNGSSDNPSSIQKAIIGLQDRKIANLIFRSFDICSVCTTH
ncbi:nickel-dependent hydrogenase large subunit [Nitratiruptor sp. YY09-18]|uniref:nickel-dependent hydrogenase large subunit n=1 Tax=Nitratiruptor sp. YY09-18 TaxID=2724901 RepID=UPI001915154F|nr:nickel-dependent hydrogenase large subunit [Nitratiruptor sp. YY09-18]BCD68116.1 hydrogenase large subunit [Nitratiruptor sp. YY09-18]